MVQTILFTGGGSAGHVTPNLALIEYLQQEGFDIAYMGGAGIEKTLMNAKKVPYYEISSGKLRRELKLQNLIDPFKVLWGGIQAFFRMSRIKPLVIFSKGGFVSVPVVLAGYLRKIPIIIHESDFTPGLANKICTPFASKICVNYPETKAFFSKKANVIVTGTPIRESFYRGSKERALEFLGFSGKKPLLLITGGGLGSVFLNQLVIKILSPLCQQFHVIHLCGKGKKPLYEPNPDYRVYEYLEDEMFDVMVAADLVISRAGANALYELLALKKLSLLVPLSTKASRGDQLDNARFAEEKGYAKVLQEEKLTSELLLSAIIEMRDHPESYQKALASFNAGDAVQEICRHIKELLHGNKNI